MDSLLANILAFAGPSAAESSNTSKVAGKAPQEVTEQDATVPARSLEDRKNVHVICFTRNRPFQLQQFLSSLMQFSDVLSTNVAVLCCPVNSDEEMLYREVLIGFPGVLLAIERDFAEDLEHLISEISPNRSVMLCVDDLIFHDYVRLQ